MLFAVRSAGVETAVVLVPCEWRLDGGLRQHLHPCQALTRKYSPPGGRCRLG